MNILQLFDLQSDVLTGNEMKRVISEISWRQIRELIEDGKLEVVGARKNRKYRINRTKNVNWFEITAE